MAKKTVNTDIYNLAQLVDDVKKIYIPDETDETLAIGTYGYIGALESHRLQTQVLMTGELSNESFPSRARLERNVITHAIMANIEDINAVPAKMTVYLMINETDIKDNLDGNTFTIDRECPIYVGDYEFHLEYDVKVTAVAIPGTTPVTYSYYAQYIIPDYRDVPTSTILEDNITNYISPPAKVKSGTDNFIMFTVQIAQVTHSLYQKKIVTANIVDNKTVNFEFEDQLAYFEIEALESDEDRYILPVFEGAAVPSDTNYLYHCWYQYIDTNLIRVRFDRSSYMPGLNAQINCIIKTTKGSEGNFSFKDDIGWTLSSSTYGYKNIPVYIKPATASAGGKDRKSKSELQALIPKELLARGSITTITDLNNYFSMLDTEVGRVVIQKKMDNQIERVYYAYLLTKDANNNVIPTNTIDIKVGLEDLVKSESTESKSARYILKSGSCIKLLDDGYGHINHDPLFAKLYTFTPGNIGKGKLTTCTFKCIVDDPSQIDADQVGCGVSVGGADTPVYLFPGTDELAYGNATDTPIEAEDYLQLCTGQTYIYSAEYVTMYNNNIIDLQDYSLACLDFVSGYYYTDDPEDVTYFDTMPYTFKGYPKNTRINIKAIYKYNGKPNRVTQFTYNTKTADIGSSSTITDFDNLLFRLGIYDTIIDVTGYDSTIFEIVKDPQNPGNYTIKILKDFDTTESITLVTSNFGYYTISCKQISNEVKSGIIIKEYNASEGELPENTVSVIGNVRGTDLIVTDPEAYVAVTTLVITSIESIYAYTCYAPSLTYDKRPDTLKEGDVITYTFAYRSCGAYYKPEIEIKCTEGLTYVPFSLSIVNEDGVSYSLEPVTTDLRTDEFIYANPYAISVNGYKLYSSFYMMTLDYTRYLRYQWSNDASNIQFIATTVGWNRQFLVDKDTYHMSISLTQSVQDDLGVIPTDGSDPLVKCIAVFYKDNKAFRYRSLNLVSYDADTFTFNFERDFISEDLFDDSNNIKIDNLIPSGQREDIGVTTIFTGNDITYSLTNEGTISKCKLIDFLANFGITGTISTDTIPVYDPEYYEITYDKTEKVYYFKMIKEVLKGTAEFTVTMSDGKEYTISAANYYVEYGFMNSTTKVVIYSLCGLPDINGTYTKYDLETYAPLVDKNWTVTNKYEIVNDIDFYENYSEIMGSRVVPYGTDEDGNAASGNTVMNLEGYYLKSIPVIGYDYSQNETLIQGAINTFNNRKAYFDNALILLENSFGIDFKLFNTYGPSKTYYIVQDTDKNMILDEGKEYINKVNLKMYFRVKLTAEKDSYTKQNIISDIKAYMEDLDDLSELHIPNLVAQITNSYKEQITYFEYLGFNDYGADVQHIYKDQDDDIPIHVVPEFLNINNSWDLDGNLTPDITVYVSEI